MGPYMGFMTGLACLLEFVFAPPAIAVATGAYINFLFPSINAVYATVAVFLFFIFINLIGVKGAAIIELVATVLALIGLGVYYVAGLPHVNGSAIFSNMSAFKGWTGIFASIPFAIWFFLAIEGERWQQKRCVIPKGYTKRIYFGDLDISSCNRSYVACNSRAWWRRRKTC